MRRAPVFFLLVAVAVVAQQLGAPRVRAGEFEERRDLVESVLCGGYIHSRIHDKGGCSIAPVKDRPGVFLFEGEGSSGKSLYRLADDNPYKLVKIEGESHPPSATVVITERTVEIVWTCPEGDEWIRPR